MDPDPLVALAGGDPEPFETFVRLAAGPLLGFFGRMGADPHEAEDLTQQTFVRLYEHAQTYRPRQRFGAFVFRIARNALVDLRRRTGRAARGEECAAEELAEPSGGGATPAPAAQLELAEEAAKLRRGMQRLPEAQRAVFELAIVHEAPYADIAAALDIPVGTVKSRMHHAVRSLRAWMEPAEAAAPSRHGAAGPLGEVRR